MKLWSLETTRYYFFTLFLQGISKNLYDFLCYRSSFMTQGPMGLHLQVLRLECTLKSEILMTKSFCQRWKELSRIQDLWFWSEFSQVYSSEGKFTFTSHTPGEHVICLYRFPSLHATFLQKLSVKLFWLCLFQQFYQVVLWHSVEGSPWHPGMFVN